MRTAVFVDAGYLFSQGSFVLTGRRIPRADVELDLSATTNKLREFAEEKASGSSLLRIYWYDGMLPGGWSGQQLELADADDVKLRLGVVNNLGQQKEVDSLIVTDLVELARNRAISDAVLVSGDADVRIGVQIAQSFGVRVHLIGIGAPGHHSQARTLRQEADTTTEWDEDDIGRILRATPSYEAVPGQRRVEASLSVAAETESALAEVARETVALLSENQLGEIASLEGGQNVPNEYDRRLLGMSKAKLGRYLSPDESQFLRDRFKQAAHDASQTP